MITGVHSLLYSSDAKADSVFFRQILGLPHVDVGNGWLIFGLPPAELAVHPADGNNTSELYLLCEDIEKFINAMSAKKIACTPVREQRWGLVTQLTLPSGGKLGVYQPRHPRPKPMIVKTAKTVSVKIKKQSKKK
jgi:hypothetical protein